MGRGASSVLPTSIHNNKLYFLFGKENKYEKSAPGFSDFGGGIDNNDSFFNTAVREAGEEITGFLGNEKEIRILLKKHGTYNIDYNMDHDKTYRVHIFPYEYDEKLPFYYNNNQKFLQKHLDPSVIKSTKIFEKAEIRWVCVDDIMKMRPQFRHFYRNIVDMIHEQKHEILNFIKKTHSKTTKKKTLKKRH